MFFGIGGRLINEFGKNVVEIFPDLSSIQVAFSRIKERWDDAFLVSFHGGPDPSKRRKLEYELEDIPMLLEKHNKIAILTDKVNNPVVIAKILTSKLTTLNSKLIMYVCEKLGYPDEKTTAGTPEEITEMEFSDPNVVIIVQKAESEISNLKFWTNGMTQNDLDFLKKWFSDYCKSFYSANEENNKNISLTQILNQSPEFIVIGTQNYKLIAEAIALFHDIGRFPQYAKYKTFKDNITTVRLK